MSKFIRIKDIKVRKVEMKGIHGDLITKAVVLAHDLNRIQGLEITFCDKCKYYCMGMCMNGGQRPTKRNGFCDRAVDGTYDGPAPVFKEVANGSN